MANAVCMSEDVLNLLHSSTSISLLPIIFLSSSVFSLSPRFSLEVLTYAHMCHWWYHCSPWTIFQEIRATETQVLVSILGDDSALAAELVGELWHAKVKAEFMIHKKVMKHIDRARDSRIPWMVLVGERELSEGVVKLKDVVAAIDYEVPRGKLVDDLCKRLGM